jgi:hypothetical protein
MSDFLDVDVPQLEPSRISDKTVGEDAAGWLSAEVTATLRSGSAEYYAFVVDRSSRGAEFMREIMRVRDELCYRLNTDAFAIWRESAFEFCVVMGSYGANMDCYSRTIPIRDPLSLLQDAIPVIAEFAKSHGRSCAFFAGIEPRHAAAAEHRLIELMGESRPPKSLSPP